MKRLQAENGIRHFINEFVMVRNARTENILIKIRSTLKKRKIRKRIQMNQSKIYSFNKRKSMRKF